MALPSLFHTALEEDKTSGRSTWKVFHLGMITLKESVEYLPSPFFYFSAGSWDSVCHLFCFVLSAKNSKETPANDTDAENEAKAKIYQLWTARVTAVVLIIGLLYGTGLALQMSPSIPLIFSGLAFKSFLYIVLPVIIINRNEKLKKHSLKKFKQFVTDFIC